MTNQIAMNNQLLLLILVAFMTTGCGTASSVRMNARAADKVTFGFLDERSEKERLSRKEDTQSGVITYIGDSDLSPAAPDLLKSYLSAQLDETLAGKNVRLTLFSISTTDPRVSIDANQFNNSVSSVPKPNFLGTLLAAPVILGIESIKSKKLVQVGIRIFVDDQEFFSLCSDSFRGRATENNIQALVSSCLKKISEKVKVAYAT